MMIVMIVDRLGVKEDEKEMDSLISINKNHN